MDEQHREMWLAQLKVNLYLLRAVNTFIQEFVRPDGEYNKVFAEAVCASIGARDRLEADAQTD